MKANIAIVLLFISFSVGLFSCKSSKSTTSSNSYKPNKESVIDGTNSQSMSNVEKSLVNEAKSWIGTKYKFGGNDKDGVDCSGFVMAVYNNAIGLKIPRTTREQREFCKSISQDKLTPGDLVFFTGSDKSGGVGHVGMYIGNGEWIHASLSRGVTISKLQENYWVDRYVSSGRVPILKKGDIPKTKNSPQQVKEIPKQIQPAINKTAIIDTITKYEQFDAKTAVKNAFRLEEAIDSKIDSIYKAK
jgi:hypothetical protein